MKRLLAVLLFTFIGELGAAAPHVYSEEMLNQVAQSRYWRLLLHMKSDFFGGSSSSAYGGDFLLSPKGKRDPLAELKETILAFSQDRKIGFFGQHPQCAFPERFRFLQETLKLNIEKVPCPEFENWIQGLSPESVTLVFSAGFENNPSSVFGHTFLRINSRPKDGEVKKDLLDYGIGYAAAAENEPGLEFAIRGLFGGYYGVFEILPYYMKVNLYNHSESRDLWEYDLNLDPEQVRRMLGHLWELRGTAIFNYYFIDENCAYMILALLEVAEPKWKLLNRVPWYVIPSDTVKAVTREAGAIKNVKFRPSLYKKLASQFNHLESDQQRDSFFKLIKMETNPKDVTDVDVMDAALANFQYLKYKIGNEVAPEQSLYFKNLLVRRSQLPVTSENNKMDWGQEDVQSRPDLSHGSFQLGGYLGTSQNKLTQELHFRMGLHDWMNQDAGLPRNSNFEWLQVSLRNIEDAGFTLERLDILNIKSIFSRNRLQKLYSWKVNVQYRTPKDMDCGSCKTAYGAAAGGWGTDISSGWTLYSLFGVASDAGDAFALGYRFGPTAELGSVWTISEKWKLGISLQTNYDLTEKDGRQNFHEVLFEQGYAVSTKWDLRMRVYHIPVQAERRSFTEGLVGANYYFF
jgi:hypothetical protein